MLPNTEPLINPNLDPKLAGGCLGPGCQSPKPQTLNLQVDAERQIEQSLLLSHHSAQWAPETRMDMLTVLLEMAEKSESKIELMADTRH